MPFVPLRLHTVPGYKVRLKRLFDLFVVVLFVPLWVPVLALLALYVLVRAGRPVFYRQSAGGSRWTHLRVHQVPHDGS